MKVLKGGGSSLDNINPLWAAPEVLRGDAYTTLSDVYAMGVMMWELLTREDPYDEVVTRTEGCRVDGTAFMECAKRRILAGDRPVFPADTPTDYRTLVEQCWQPHSSKCCPNSSSRASKKMKKKTKKRQKRDRSRQFLSLRKQRVRQPMIH